MIWKFNYLKIQFPPFFRNTVSVVELAFAWRDKLAFKAEVATLKLIACTHSSNDDSVQFSSVTQLCLTLCDPWIAAHQASLFITKSQSLHKLMSIESVMPSSHLILCRPLLFLPPIPPSIRVFSNESTLHMRWPKYWSFSFSISPSNEHPGLISFRMDWLDLLVDQGTQRDGIGREAGGGIGMGNTCKSMADSYQCIAKTTTIL